MVRSDGRWWGLAPFDPDADTKKFTNWRPTTSDNKDRIMLTPLGQHQLVARVEVNKVLPEEQFYRQIEWLKERPETVEYLARPKGSRRKPSSRESIKQ